jgi:hypothetical protein
MKGPIFIAIVTTRTNSVSSNEGVASESKTAKSRTESQIRVFHYVFSQVPSTFAGDFIID